MADPLHLAGPRVLSSQVLPALPTPHPGPVAARECPTLPRPDPSACSPRHRAREEPVAPLAAVLVRSLPAVGEAFGGEKAAGRPGRVELREVS